MVVVLPSAVILIPLALSVALALSPSLIVRWPLQFKVRLPEGKGKVSLSMILC